MTPIERARAAWGNALPDWVEALAVACTRRSQGAVARDLGRSASYVSCILSNTYAGDMRAARELISGRYLSTTIACPALGDIGTDRCLEWRRRARGEFSSRNAQTIQMYRACHRCPVFKAEEARDE